ncbi:MAG: cardiolipin synthase [Lachnospiraceae bacterium]
MQQEKKVYRDVKNSIGRGIIAGISIVVQVLWFAALFYYLNNYSAIISFIISLLTLVVVLKIYGNDMNSGFKISWITVILVFPIIGICMYFMFGKTLVMRMMRKNYEKIDAELFSKLEQKEHVLKELEEKDLGIANQFNYNLRNGKFPVYKNTDVVFYKEAVDGFNAQIEAIKKAEKFIFMEYHAIEDAGSFAELKEVLIERANAGVEVRVLYDDIGSLGFINVDFIKRLKKDGIECRVFNPIMPIFHMFMNNRDHRKITVIDGKVGFTGGYNLADEYFNLIHPFGYWKDTGVRLEGEAVRSLTILFLEMWNAIKATDDDKEKYLTTYFYVGKEENGYIQPYADSPLDDENTGENVYLNMIKNAKKYVYVATPYLIITDEMTLELGLAAKRGVDVRIITPGIPDKKLIYQATRSYYPRLVNYGVRIYEYTPGFLHEKQMIADDEIAVVGTINLDYRSLYHHFENAVLIYGYQAVKEIKIDMDETIAVSRDVTGLYSESRKNILKIRQSLLRFLAPLM